MPPKVPHGKQVTIEAHPNQFPGWKEVLHPSWPVATAGQTPPAVRDTKKRPHHQSSEARRAPCQRVEEWLQVGLIKSASPSSEPLEVLCMVALPLGFERVTTCLWGDLLPAATIEVPSDLLWPEAAVEPAVATMCASCVIQDEASGVTYVEMVTTSVWWVAFTHAPPVVQSPQLIIEDIMDLPKNRRKQWLP